MPSVSEAIEAKAAQDMMASLAAYNGAVLTGNFADSTKRQPPIRPTPRPS